MTVLIGYLTEKGGRSALDLGVQIARALHDDAGRPQPITIATVVPRQWATPSLAKVDAEFGQWADQLAADAEASARAYLADQSDLQLAFERASGRSTPSALAELAEKLEATVLVLGSSADGRHGQVVVGSTASHLLHSAPVPLAIAPRGHRISGAPTRRVTCAYSGEPEAIGTVRLAARLTRQLDVGLRIATFGVRNRTMFPPEVATRTEDDVLNAWYEQVGAAQRALVAELGDDLDPDSSLVVGAGLTWADALDDVEWEPGELLFVGSGSAGALRRVFLGSRATKMIRYAPVPVVVFPG